LVFRGFFTVGDSRVLEMMVQQLITEQRRNSLTHQTLSGMRQTAAEYHGQDSSV
jgi:hypothetical protein